MNLEVPPELPLKLVGWISDADGRFGFCWDSASGNLVWGDEWFVGSGGAAFEANVADYRGVLNPNTEPDVNSALQGLLALLAQLNCTDRLVQEGNDAGIGGGYETLYWSTDDEKFQYLDRVLYFVLVCRMDARGRLRKDPELIGDSLTTYRAAVAGDHSVLTFSEREAHDIWVMSPVGAMAQRKRLYEWLRREAAKPMDLTADYYAGLAMFAAPMAPAPPLPAVTGPWDDVQGFRSSRGRFEFHINKGAVEKAYRDRAAAYAAAPYPLGQMKI